MTPKEKAKELVSKMYKQIFEIDYGADISEDLKRFQSAKQCALIAAAEMIEEYSNEIVPYLYGSRFGFWQQVKEEIVSL